MKRIINECLAGRSLRESKAAGRFVGLDEALELMEEGYELGGVGMYCNYRFTMKPGADRIDYWALERYGWDNGSYRMDEFARRYMNMRFCVRKDPEGKPITWE